MPLKDQSFLFDSDKILSKLSKEDMNYFLSFAQLLSFKKGSLLFYEKGIPTGFFILKKGKAKIYKTGIYGKDQIFYIYKEGDLFGYHALLANEKFMDACEALEDCEVLFIDRYDFEHLLEKIKNLKLLFIQNISHEFGVLVNIITILAQKPLRERLALYLLILDQVYKDSKTKKSEINLSREDLANIIGATRESLGRMLKEFKDDKLIRVEKRKIEVSNLKQMRKIANF